MKKIILVATCFFVYNISAMAQWSQKASMFDYGRRSAVGGSVDSKGYVGLGAIYDNMYLSDFWEYDILTNSWTEMESYPGAGLYEATSFSLKGKFYICLGFSNAHACQNDLWEYNPITNSWTQKTSFPGIARYGARAFTIGDSAFVVGGSANGGSYLNDMYMYNPTLDKWIRKADFAGGSKSQGTAFSIDGFGYYGLGLSNSMTTTNDFWKYNPIFDLWSPIHDYPGASRNVPVNFVLDRKAYVGLGSNIPTSLYYDDFFLYDPDVETWQALTAVPPYDQRTGAFAFSSGIYGFIGGGLNSTGVLTDLWSFDLSIYNGFENNTNDYFNVFPIPTQNNIEISLKNSDPEKYALILTSVDGKEVLSLNVEFQDRYKLDLSGIANGVYLLRLQNRNKQFIKKIILQK